MEDALKLRLLAARLRHLALQIETKTLKSIGDFGDIFSLGADQGVAAFLRGELKLRDDFEAALRVLAGTKSVGVPASTITKQFNPSEIEGILAQAKRKRT